MEFPNTPPTKYTNSVMLKWREKNPDASVSVFNREYERVWENATEIFNRSEDEFWKIASGEIGAKLTFGSVKKKKSITKLIKKPKIKKGPRHTPKKRR